MSKFSAVILGNYGPTFIAVNGKEAVEAFRATLDSNEPYDLICMDIMMPQMDGQTALKQIRQMEENSEIYSSQGVKIIMTTALGDMKNVSDAFHSLCDAYLTKPVRKKDLVNALESLKLISSAMI